MKYLFLILLSNTIHCDVQKNSLNGFTYKLLEAALSLDDENFVISPLSVWSLFTVVAEAAVGDTRTQLIKGLNHPVDAIKTKNLYDNAYLLLNRNTSEGVETSHSIAVFIDESKKIDREFCKYIAKDYYTEIYKATNPDPKVLVKDINDYVAFKTNGSIKNAVDESVVENLDVLLLDIINFKGLWTRPFSEFTEKQTFYDDNGKKLGEVDMMFQHEQNGIEYIEQISSRVLEMGYGPDKLYSMLIFVPYDNQQFNAAAKKILNYPLENVLKKLNATYENSDFIDTFVPRFQISSETDLKTPMEILGISDVFDPNRSLLPGISSDPLYISKAYQKAIITVNEQGTEAKAVTLVGLEDRISSQRFVVNKPFLFMIVNRKNSDVLFAGVFKKP